MCATSGITYLKNAVLTLLISYRCTGLSYVQIVTIKLVLNVDVGVHI